VADDSRLDSWKEIAAYLGREVRTVQLWEKGEGLPIHRHQHSRQGSVYAFKPELDAWRAARKPVAPEEPLPNRRKRRTVALWAASALAVLAVASFVIWRTHRASGETISSVVVLPFADFSPHQDLEYFGDGLTEEIIDALSRVPNLRVVARTSAFAFKGAGKDIREIGKQLNVGGVIEGSVQEFSGQVRITVQLNRVSDGTHLWSRKYDRPLRDVFAIQNEISQAIANELRGNAIVRTAPTTNAEAYRLYEEGRYFFNQFQPPESNQKAIERYQKAIQLDPNFALAYAGLSEAYAYLAENFVSPPREVMPKAKEAAEKAVALDPNSAQTHTALAAVKLDYDWDRDGAAKELDRALQLNPGSAWAQHWYAHSLEAQGRFDEATKQLRSALELDPLSIPIYWDIGNELIGAHRYDDALQHLAKGTDLFPNVQLIEFEKMAAYYGKGDVASAHGVVEALKNMGPAVSDAPLFMASFGVAAVREGRPSEGMRLLDRLEQLRQKQYVEPAVALGLCEALKDQRGERFGSRGSARSDRRYFSISPCSHGIGARSLTPPHLPGSISERIRYFNRALLQAPEGALHNGIVLHLHFIAFGHAEFEIFDLLLQAVLNPRTLDGPLRGRRLNVVS
jgi:TolB-like protein/Tfp pilus assembly protein PilF